MNTKKLEQDRLRDLVIRCIDYTIYMKEIFTEEEREILIKHFNALNDYDTYVRLYKKKNNSKRILLELTEYQLKKLKESL